MPNLTNHVIVMLVVVGRHHRGRRALAVLMRAGTPTFGVAGTADAFVVVAPGRRADRTAQSDDPEVEGPTEGPTLANPSSVFSRGLEWSC
jgi:hypothetical protein